MRKSLLGAIVSCVLSTFSLAAQQDAVTGVAQTRFKAMDTGRTVLVQEGDGRVRCRRPESFEAHLFDRRAVPLHVISPATSRVPYAGGLTIQLRATAQLEGFPAAKAAFIRAASTWQSLLTTQTTPVTIVIDVDFGTTRFGQVYPEGVLGSAGSQDVGDTGAYPDARAGLVANASTAAEQTLFATLPTETIPTDQGATAGIFGASAPLRAIGLLSAVADPAAEQATLGDPPSIGFNSNFTFDFNPDDGVTPGQIDFLTTATHEIGHVLGFGSNVGLKELAPAFPTSLTLLDLFRFRPGIASGSFTTGQRILSTGGSQRFYSGTSEIALSTGNPSGENGDGQQASHWKDDDLGGSYIGIMDPTLPSGVTQAITEADKLAFDSIGWKLAGSSSGAPAAPSNLTATATASSVIRLSWTDNSSDETEFRVEQLSGASFVDIGSAAANATSINVTGFTAGTTATFRIRARNASGDSAYSNEASATTLSDGPTSCTASATVLCIDSAAGDKRFKVSVTFQTSQGGGLSGNGAAIALNSLGVTKGGLFSFFSADNPEMLVKVLNGCGVNNHHWVFITAGTNVGLVTTVTDTKNGTTKTYTNNDLTPAQPVQDTSAFATCP